MKGSAFRPHRILAKGLPGRWWRITTLNIRNMVLQATARRASNGPA
jgi:hypothetical protein